MDSSSREDSIADIGAEPIQLALMQLRKHGLDTSNLCNLTETQQAVIYMQNAKAIIEEELRDKQEWHLTVGKHHFHRDRAYSNVRFAVVECLLLVTVVALAFLIWTK